MRGRELSYRRRRRLVGLTLAALVAGGVASAIVLLPKAHKPDRSVSGPPPRSEQIASRAPARQTRLSHADEEHLRSTIALFVSTSVARHHPERSWAIVHPVLREGMTKRQWSTGNIPVVPYPAAGVDLLTLQSMVGRTALLEVMLEPPRGSKLVRKTFQIELRRAPQALHGWLVSSWVPEGVSESQINADAARTTPASVVAAAYHAQHLSAKWIFVPLGILLGGLILVPSGVFARHALQSRRAKAEFRASFFDDSGEFRR